MPGAGDQTGHPGMEKWLELNAEYSKSWPNITEKKDPPANAKEFDGASATLRRISAPIQANKPDGRN
jgi:Domain of unknown function (DUF3470)